MTYRCVNIFTWFSNFVPASSLKSFILMDTPIHFSHWCPLDLSLAVGLRKNSIHSHCALSLSLSSMHSALFSDTALHTPSASAIAITAQGQTNAVPAMTEKYSSFLQSPNDTHETSHSLKSHLRCGIIGLNVLIIQSLCHPADWLRRFSLWCITSCCQCKLLFTLKRLHGIHQQTHRGVF